MPDTADAANDAENTDSQQDKAGQDRLPLPLPDQAYQLHLRGHTLRDIARLLDITKDTANKYVRDLERENTPRRKEDRARWRRQAVAKLELVQSAAWGHWTEAHDPMLLNTIASCEDKIAKLRALYDQELEDGASEVRITISRRGAVSAQTASTVALTGGDDGRDPVE